jgi:hypothetical protein
MEGWIRPTGEDGVVKSITTKTTNNEKILTEIDGISIH